MHLSQNCSKSRCGNSIAILILLCFSLALLPGMAQSDNAIKVDARIDKAEKHAYGQALKQGDKFAQQQAHVINKVPGMEVSSEDLKEKEVKKDFSLNPIAWLFKPVIRLQEQSVRLEQQIMKLTGPIAALQPGMLGLENKMTHVQGQMVNMGGQIGRVENKMGDVRGQMAGMQKDISAMRVELGQIKQPITDLKGPIMQLHDPLLDIQKPVSTVGTKLESLDKQLADLKTLISLVLTAIFVSAGMIAVGTPIAAILIWRNKSKLLPKAKPEEEKQEADISRVGKAMDKQLS